MASGWRPTHQTCDAGAPAWVRPDPTTPSATALDPRLPVLVVESLDHGWTQVRCENGWDLGVWMSDFYRHPANAGVPLSAMLDLYLQQTGGGMTGRTTYF